MKMLYIDTIEFYSAVKKNGIGIRKSSGTLTDLENIILTGGNPDSEDKNLMASLTCGS